MLTNVYFWTCFHPKKAVLLGGTRGMGVTLFRTNTQQESVAASSTFLQELAISCRVRDPASCNLTCKCWRINGERQQRGRVALNLPFTPTLLLILCEHNDTMPGI